MNFEPVLSFSELEARPHFVEVANISIENHGVKLGELVSAYHFKERVKCGISSCRQGHLKGYLVTLSNNQEIIIGHICGKKYFGVDFLNKDREFRAKKLKFEKFEAMKETFNNLVQMKQEFEQVLMSSGPLSFIQIKNGIRALSGSDGTFDYWMKQELKRISVSGVIKHTVQKTQKEIETEEFFRKENEDDVVYIRETKTVVAATLDNWELVGNWYQAEKLRSFFEIIHSEIKNPIAMNYHEFESVYSKLKNYQSNLKALRNYCEMGNSLLSRNNLSKLAFLFSKKDQLNKLNDFIQRFNEGGRGEYEGR